MNLGILESSRNTLLLVRYFNLVSPSLHRQEASPTLGIAHPILKSLRFPHLASYKSQELLGCPVVLLVLKAFLKKMCTIILSKNATRVRN
jgi:hypothetical protein